MVVTSVATRVASSAGYLVGSRAVNLAVMRVALMADYSADL